jgi:hypothetical protein
VLWRVDKELSSVEMIGLFGRFDKKYKGKNDT